MTDTIIITLFSILILVIILSSTITWKFLGSFFKRIKRIFKPIVSEDQKRYAIKEIEKAILSIRKKKKGATIIIDQLKEADSYIVDSQIIDANVKSELIESIFFSASLHDGAMVIIDNKIKDVSAFITSLSENKSAPKSYGTRHRSALGISEQTNAVVVVLSEETQKVTIFKRGKWQTVALKNLFIVLLNNWTR